MVTDTLLRAYREEQLRGIDEHDRSETERVLAAIPYPRTLAAFDGLMVDARGNLWVRNTKQPRDTGAVWGVFNSDGAYVGRIDIPSNLRLTHLGSEFVVGISQVLGGHPEVLVYALEARHQ